MPDVFTKVKRSAVMARIRGAGNKDTELRLIALMRAAGVVGWRRGRKLCFRVKEQGARGRSGVVGPDAGSPAPTSSVLSVPSVVKIRPVTIRPDFVFPKQRVAVFVDGCFFHGCPKHATWPKNNAQFWRTKIQGNIARDRLQNRLLRRNGWLVLRIWEHALTAKRAASTLATIRRAMDARAVAG